MRLAIVGCGSSGKRHMGNFKALGVEEIAGVDPRTDRLEEARTRHGVTELYASLDEALANKPFDAAVVCTPPVWHIPVATALINNGISLLIEKPLAVSVDGVEDMLQLAKRRGLVVITGYTYRFWPPLLKLKELLDENAVGQVYAVRVIFSEYLPDWHLWEDYRSWFMAKKEEGGGAILENSHTLDFVRWLFGEIKEISCFDEKVSRLEVTSDDIAVMLVRFASGAVGTIHQDIFGRLHQRSIDVLGERGNLHWDFFQNRVEWYNGDEKKREVFPFTCERNDMFVAEAKHLLRCIDGKEKPHIDGWDGLRTLECVLAALRSSETKQSVQL
ncbi:MAG: Gfo/Idh/MocA family oxidoreductase [Dehalococcoidia bacterium]